MYMRLGLKKPHMNRLGLKKQAHTMMRFGLKASDIALAAAPVALLGGPEMAPVASALEVAGGAGKAIFGLGSKVV
jgi:hypothetical protein